MSRWAMRRCSRSCQAEYGSLAGTVPRRLAGKSLMTSSKAACAWPPLSRTLKCCRNGACSSAVVWLDLSVVLVALIAAPLRCFYHLDATLNEELHFLASDEGETGVSALTGPSAKGCLCVLAGIYRQFVRQHAAKCVDGSRSAERGRPDRL